MTYAYPPGGGVRAPPRGGYGHHPPPPTTAPPGDATQSPASITGPPGPASSANRGSFSRSQPPAPQQPPLQQHQQYGGYAPHPGQYGGYGTVAPPSQPPPSRQEPPQQAQRPPMSMPPATTGMRGPPMGGGVSSFTRSGPPSNGIRMGTSPPPPPGAPPPVEHSAGGAMGQRQLPPPPTSQPPQQQGMPGTAPGQSSRGAQFYVVGGSGAPSVTPMQHGPPTSQDLSARMGQMSLGPPPNGVPPPPRGPPSGARMGPGVGPPQQAGANMAGGYGGMAPPAGPPTMQQMQPPPPGYGGAPAQGAGYAPRQGAPPAQGAQGAPAPAMGGSTGGTIPGQPILPSIHETDMSIQADPRVMRMTMGAIPNSSTAHVQSKLPLGIVIQAMALDMEQKDGGLEVVNFGAQGIMRCKRCRTYINPFVSWLSNGRQWRCNVCGMVNDVPTGYMCHLDQEGNRTDKAERPELSQASVELVAPAEYMVRPPQPPVYMFVIDVSAPAVASGMVQVAAETIKECLDRLPGEERTMVGVCTFDSTVHYYSLKSNLSQPQLYVVPDLADPFLPVPDDLLVNLSDSRAVVETLLDSLAQMHANTRDTECCLGPALSAAGKVMGHVGGKMVVLCSSLPSTGEARLKHRENPRSLGTEREHLLLSAEDPWYQNKAVEFSKMQICVDLFLFSAQYTDVATLSNLPKFTAGQLFYYQGFTAHRDGEKFHSELTRILTRPTAFEAVMRVRTTRGLRITNFYGNYFIRGTDLLALPNCTPDSVFAVEFGYDEQILGASVICIQTALLYTTSGGERRIRVHNLAIPVETVIQNVFNSVNIDVLCNILAKQALQVALKSGLEKARSRIEHACVDIVRASRGGGYGASPYMGRGAQTHDPMSMSEAIQLLPLYSMALQKNVAFRGGTDVRTDERAYMQLVLSNMPVDHSRCFTYPRMFRLHDMPDDAGEPLASEEGEELIPTAGRDVIKLPPVANLSVERLSSDGVFLLENGVELLLWVGQAASPSILTALFGLSSLDGQDLSSLQIQPEGNHLWKRMINIITALREERMAHLKVTMIGAGDGANERRFFWHLVEDRASFPGGAMNYAEYMDNINRHSVGGMPVAMG